jgi:hypothetical protein
MKKTQKPDAHLVSEDLATEYHFDYQQAKPNRFANRSKENRTVIVLDPDVAQVFTTPEAVNDVLRALISTMPPVKKHKVKA